MHDRHVNLSPPDPSSPREGPYMRQMHVMNRSAMKETSQEEERQESTLNQNNISDQDNGISADAKSPQGYGTTPIV